MFNFMLTSLDVEHLLIKNGNIITRASSLSVLLSLKDLIVFSCCSYSNSFLPVDTNRLCINPIVEREAQKH